MPATSEAQRRAAGAALAYKRGQSLQLKGASKQMAKMSEASLRDFARMPHHKIPMRHHAK